MILLNAEIHLMIISLIYTWIKFDYVFPLDLVHLRFQMVLDNRSIFKNLRIELLPLFLGLLSDFSNLVLLFFAHRLRILIEAHSQKLTVIVFEAYGDLHAVIEAVKYYFTVVFANNRIKDAFLIVLEVEKLIQFKAAVEQLVGRKVYLL